MSKKRSVHNKKVHAEKASHLGLYLAIVLALTALLINMNTIDAGYALDDSSAIEDNFLVKRGFDGIPDLLKTSYRYGYWNEEGTLYRPLSLVMFAAEYELFPDTPWVYHLLNVLFYTLSALLLFKVLRLLFNRYHIIIPFLVSLLFVTHPIHTEVVANIKSRDEIMAFLFALLSFYWFFNYLEKPQLKLLLFSMLAYFIAFFSKESVITFLALYPLFYYYHRGYEIKQLLKFTGIYAIPAIGYLFTRFIVIGDVDGIDDLSIIENVLAGAENKADYYASSFLFLGKYLKMSFLPWPLSSDYSYPESQVVTWANPLVWLSLLVFLFMAAVTVYGILRKNMIALGLAYFLITMSIFSNLVITIGTAFGERLLYVPILGICISFVFALHKLFSEKQNNSKAGARKSNKQYKQLMIGSVVLLSLIFSGFTINRNSDWQDNFTLYQADVSTCPNSSRLHHFYGLELLQNKSRNASDAATKEMYLDSAISEFNRAIELYEFYSNAYERLAYAMTLKGDKPKALELYLKTLELDPGSSITYNNMGLIYFEMQDYDKAIEVYQKAIQFNPRFADAYFNLGSTYGTIGKFELSVQNFKKCIEFDPDKAHAYYYAGLSLRSMNKQAEAAEYFKKAAQLDAQFR